MKSVLIVATLASLLGAPLAIAGTPVTDAMAGDHRSEANRARDPYRHPAETLEFFGFQPHLTVLEIWPGGGWYTEILAPAMSEDGKLILAVYGEGPDTSAYRARNHRKFVEKLGAREDLYGGIDTFEFWPPETTSLGASDSVDLIVTFRNMHSMLRRDQNGVFFKEAFRVLKPGGALGIVQHRAPEGADARTMADEGYVPTDWVIAQATAAGFVLDGTSEINANPKDTKDYVEGVWTLPPSLDAEDGRDDEYRAIGESDRMTLRFVRPFG